MRIVSLIGGNRFTLFLTAHFYSFFLLLSKNYIRNIKLYFEIRNFSQSLVSNTHLVPSNLWKLLYIDCEVENLLIYFDMISLYFRDCDILRFCNWGQLKPKGKINVFHLLWEIGDFSSSNISWSIDSLSTTKGESKVESSRSKETQRFRWRSEKYFEVRWQWEWLKQELRTEKMMLILGKYPLWYGVKSSTLWIYSTSLFESIQILLESTQGTYSNQFKYFLNLFKALWFD